MNEHAWYQNAIFYHLYPLGLVGAPEKHHIGAAVELRLNQLYPWIGHAIAWHQCAFLGRCLNHPPTDTTHGIITRLIEG